MRGLFDPLFLKGLQRYWKGDYVKSLPDEAIETHIAQAAHAPSNLSLMHLYPIDGAVHRVAKDATAWNARDATFSMVTASVLDGIDVLRHSAETSVSAREHGSLRPRQLFPIKHCRLLHHQ